MLAPVDLAVGDPGALIHSRDYEIIAAGFQSLQEQLLDLQSSNQKLQFENETLRLRLSQRKLRHSFERKLWVIFGAWLLLLLSSVGATALYYISPK